MTRARQLLLDLGAVLGAVCLVAALAAVVLDVRPMVFRSGSMAPAIETGALALVQATDAAELREGDVVTVPTTSGSLVTHRIVGIARHDEGATLRLRGDANEAPDEHTHHVARADRVVASVPGVGYAVGWLTGPFGRFSLGLYAAFLVMVLVRPRSAANARGRGRERRSGRRRAPRPRTRGRAVAVGAMVVLLGAAGIARSTPGWAAWTDGVGVSGTSLSAHSVDPPAAVLCAASGATATVSWVDKDPRYDYEVVLKTADGTVVSTMQVTGAGTSRGYTAPDDFGLGGLGLNSYYFRAEVRSYLASSPTWRGAAVRVSTQRIRVDITLILPRVSCVD